MEGGHRTPHDTDKIKLGKHVFGFDFFLFSVSFFSERRHAPRYIIILHNRILESGKPPLIFHLAFPPRDYDSLAFSTALFFFFATLSVGLLLTVVTFGLVYNYQVDEY
jgi:hypothetical protein